MVLPLVGNTETYYNAPLHEAYPHTVQPYWHHVEGDCKKRLPCRDYKRIQPSVSHHLIWGGIDNFMREIRGNSVKCGGLGIQYLRKSSEQVHGTSVVRFGDLLVSLMGVGSWS